MFVCSQTSTVLLYHKSGVKGQRSKVNSKRRTSICIYEQTCVDAQGKIILHLVAFSFERIDNFALLIWLRLTASKNLTNISSTSNLSQPTNLFQWKYCGVLAWKLPCHVNADRIPSWNWQEKNFLHCRTFRLQDDSPQVNLLDVSTRRRFGPMLFDPRLFISHDNCFMCQQRV